MEGKIIVLYGPSGAGKTRLGEILQEIGIIKLVSDTSRAIREYDGEIDGVSYNFKTIDEFLNNIEEDNMVEYAEYCGNLYGLSKKEVYDKLQHNNIVFAVTETNGVINLKKTFGNQVVPVFVYIDKDTLKERLIKRGDSESLIKERLEKFELEDELSNIIYSDFCIINKYLNNSIAQLKNILNIISK